MVPLEQRLTGAILIVGAVVFFLGVSIPLFSGLSLRVWSAPLLEYLALIGAHRTAWLWTNGGIVVGAILTAVGLGALSGLLEEAGDGLLSRVGLLLFGLGTIFWLVSLTFRLSVTVWAAEETLIRETPPAFFEPLQGWAGLLFFIYMVLAYLATAAYGGAMLGTELLPNWLGWLALAIGLFGALSFLVGLPTIFSIPAGIHLVPLVIGVVLLV